MAKKKIERSKADLNITSMLDVVFNLILFFILISNFAAADLPKMNIPQPNKTIAKENSDANRVVVNIVPTDENTGMIERIMFASQDYKGKMPELQAKLAQEVAKQKDVQVVLRADKRILYSDIVPVMTAIAGAGVETVNLSASSEEAK
jgi:biopolymer transport protein ExbD